ncbi:S24 family peptidase, partial [Dysgonomonas sp. Marseille-P4677]|uniref:S24 family peptidase n=1 Tax=Dysgonomonas sp. Marseille-P4677 TaxID=2364790 RepID=UPI0019132F3B
ENIVGKRQSNPSFDITNKIINSIEHINIEWLMTGNGNMLSTATTHILEEKNDTIKENIVQLGNSCPYTTKPFIHTTFPIADSFSKAIEAGNYIEIPIPFISDYDFTLRAHGDSMIKEENPQKSIEDQDIVVCRFWKNRSYIRWGEVYVLSTAEGYIIKKIMPSEKDGCIKCVSFNKKNGYDPYDLPLSEIFDWAIVVGSIRISMW